VIVTGARSSSSRLSGRLADAGANSVEIPVIEILDPLDGGACLEEALARIDDYEWVVFTSANAVERCCRHDFRSRALGRVKVAAIGAATAAALSEQGVKADLVPERFVSEALVETFPGPAAHRRASVLFPCAAEVREVLAEGLRAKGWRVDVVVAYRTVHPTPRAGDLEALAGADAVVFTSSSTVSGYLDFAGLDRVPPVVACIGPVTARAAIQAGLRVDIVAPVQTADGLAESLIEWARHQGRPGGRQ
jgi:uroporphyrinogen III methyltransferase/synthase